MRTISVSVPLLCCFRNKKKICNVLARIKLLCSCGSPKNMLLSFHLKTSREASSAVLMFLCILICQLGEPSGILHAKIIAQLFLTNPIDITAITLS